GFGEALERTAGTLVVWIPNNPALIEALKFPRMEAAVRRRYRPCERFGHIQVWVRSDETGGGSGGDRAGRGSSGDRSDPPAGLAPPPARQAAPTPLPAARVRARASAAGRGAARAPHAWVDRGRGTEPPPTKINL